MKKLCIIGGFPRAGTRQAADTINQIDGFEIKGELYSSSFRAMISAFKQSDIDHSGRWSESTYRKYRVGSVINAIAGISKGTSNPYKLSSRTVGFKCPRIEQHKDELDFLCGMFEEMTFFYCLRNVKDNYLSCKSMFNSNVDAYIKNTIISIESIIKLSEDKKYNILPFYLDSFTVADNKGAWLYENVFTHISFNLTEEQCSVAYNATKNINATESMGKKRLDLLDNSEIDKFHGFRGFKEKVSMLENLFSLEKDVLWIQD